TLIGSGPKVSPPGLSLHCTQDRKSMSPAPDRSADRLLVERCLASDERAWCDFVRAHQPYLLKVAGLLLGKDARNGDLAEEIVQEVWRALLCRRFRLLRKFDVGRGHVHKFLAGLLRKRVQRRVDRGHARKNLEIQALRLRSEELVTTDCYGEMELEEFTARLSHQEKQFFEVLLGHRDEAELPISAVYSRKLVERIFKKWLDFSNKC